ncbi:MAG: hypothetical protein II007_04425 [Gammaproteobacteria bacterium]|nr:hypothetical protein [Gammaproteobacteria bacterium]
MQRSDIKLFKAERMNDEADGGGYRTDNQVQNGVLNELFSNISSYTHAGGGVALRKAFAGIDTTTTERYLGGHLILSEPPEDPKVSVFAFVAGSDADERADAKEVVQAYRSKGLLKSNTLFGRQFPGQTAITVTSGTGFEVGGVYYIAIEDPETDTDGRYWSAVGEYFRITQITAQAGYTELNIEDPLQNEYPNLIEYWDSTTRKTKAIVKLRDTTTSVATAAYAGVTTLTQPITIGDTSAMVAAVRQPIVPVATDPVPITSQPAFTAAGDSSATAPYPRLTKRIVQMAVASDPAAVAVTYSTPVADYLEGATAQYTSGGISRTASAYFSDGALRTTLPMLPDAGSVVSLGYVSSADYSAARVASAPIARNTIYKGAGTATSNALANALRPLGGSSLTLTNLFVYDDAGALYAADGIYSGSQRAIIGTVDYAAATVTIPVDGVDQAISLAAATASTASNGFTCYWAGAEFATGISSAAFVVPAEISPQSLYIRATTPAGVVLSGTSDAAGTITGDIVGTLSGGQVDAIFSSPVRRDSVVYDGVRFETLALPESLTGLNPARLPLDGKVPIIRAYDVVVLHRTAVTTLPSVTNGQTVNLGATGLAFVDVVDADGESLWTVTNDHYSVDMATGVLTVAGTWAGFTAPFSVAAMVEEMALVTGADAGGLVRFAAPISRAFPATETYVSTALPLGDLQARVANLFSQQLWTGAWSDDRIGDPILAQFDDVNHPVEVVNANAITERWSIRFDSTTAFRVFGESRGQVAAGDTLTDLAPVNPATGQPYFTLRASGWGGSWSTDNVLRFNTVAAFKGVWFVRTIQPGKPATDYDDVRIQIRGNAE